MGTSTTIYCNAEAWTNFTLNLSPGQYIVLIKQENDDLYVYFNWIDSNGSTQSISISEGAYYKSGSVSSISGFNGFLYIMDDTTTICSIHEGYTRDIYGQEFRYYQPYDYDALRGL